MKNFLTLLLCAIALQAVSQQALWMRNPAISPDGSQIAFTYQGDLYTVQTSGGKASPLTIHPAHDFMPVWLPNGQSLAFASDRFGNFDIFIMSINGGEPQRLTYHSSNDYPTSITPDGKNILFTSLRTDMERYGDFPNRAMPELYQVPVTGGRNLMTLTTPSEAAVYNAAGTKIYFQDRKGY
ncbi:MAG TPA: peptidase S41, partial [Cyclobacteriaceae bacterium]|nr:peptidase S41 [Cyclobacteriaceae bacterium]